MLLEKRKKLMLVFLIAGSVLGISLTFYFYQVFFSANTLVESDQPYLLKIPSNSVYKNDLRNAITNRKIKVSFSGFSLEI